MRVSLDYFFRETVSLLAKIDFVMTEKLEADAGYQGFISKNVLHKHWQVQEVNPNPWNLADFLDWIDLPKRLPKRAKTQGLGRNCTMFEEARWWAYSQVLGYRLAGDSGGFYEAVLRYCEEKRLGVVRALKALIIMSLYFSCHK